MVSRALRAISTANCGSPHRGRVSFFAHAKKETKESTSRMARLLLALLAGIGARFNSPGAKYAPRAQTRGSLLPIPAAMLGGGYGDLKNQL